MICYILLFASPCIDATYHDENESEERSMINFSTLAHAQASWACASVEKTFFSVICRRVALKTLQNPYATAMAPTPPTHHPSTLTAFFRKRW